MSRALKEPRPGTRQARQILERQVHAADKSLSAAKPTDEDVHSSRKSVKKARATLRLLRPTLSKRMYRQTNRILRDAARPLGSARDARTLLHTLDSLVADATAAPRVDGLRELLKNERNAAVQTMRRPEGIARSRRMLQAVRADVTRWDTGDKGWSVLGKALRRAYAGGRTALRTAQAERRDDLLHEWRKQTQYLWHQLRLFQGLRPRAIRPAPDRFHQLSDCLGDDHDLAVLRSRVVSNPGVFEDSESADCLRGLIERHRAGLQEKAFALGKSLYKKRPRKFARGYRRYWKD
ncbi:MAG TPA: CHAD domain-containing protein [Steroidobacteraceae bacterium]|nr:CHAD domain-containing protein [Steroidobacteraceae bacterium]